MQYFYCLVILLLQIFFINMASFSIFQNPEVKQLFEVYKGHDDFSKYWPLFDQFLPCTIHFSRTLNGWLDMQNSFLDRCRYHGYCTALHTSYFKPVSRIRSVLFKVWNQTNDKHFSNIFWSIFLPHRFHKVCTVQLSFSYSYQLYGNEGDSFLFSRASPYKSYIILPIDFKINLKSPFFRISGPYLGTSKLICLNKDITAVYMACLTCNSNDSFRREIGQFGKIIAKPLIKLDSPSVTLDALDKIWHYYHSNKNNFNTKSITVKKCANIYHDQACAHCSERRLSSRSDSECNRQIIETFFNFSLRDTSDVDILAFHGSETKTTCSPAGAQFAGVRYAMFVKPINSKSTGDSIIALLSPFLYTHWVFVIACIFMLATTLQTTGFYMKDALFWIFASTLEQGEFRKGQISNKNKHLIISWLFTAFLFRNLYTTDLYSNLTKKPVAKNLPRSFKELVLNYNFPTLSTYIDLFYVKHLLGPHEKYFGQDNYL